MSTPLQTRTESTVQTDFPVEYGLLSGLTVYLLGYAATYSVAANEIFEAVSGFNGLLQLFGQSPVPTWKAVGWVFYNAHFVALEVALPGGSTVSRDLLAAQNAPLALFVVPPLLLTIAGWFVARQARHLENVRDGIRAGASITASYLLAVVVGLFVVSVTTVGTTVAPDLLSGAALAGLGYPLVFGSLGGAIAALVA